MNCSSLGNCKSYDGWAVAVGSVSVGLVVIQALVLMGSPALAEKTAPILSTFLSESSPPCLAVSHPPHARQ